MKICVKNYTNYINCHSRTFNFQLKNKLYSILSIGGYVNEINDDYNSYRILGNGNKLIEESFPKFVEDTTWAKINYRAIGANSIFNDRYAVVLYFYQDMLTLEIMEENESGNLKTVQVLDLSNVEGLSNLEPGHKFPRNGDGLCISDNKIYLLQMEKGEFFLYEYPLILNKLQSTKFKY